MARKIKLDRLSMKIGIGISIAQLLATVLFMVCLCLLNILSAKYLVFIGLVLCILCLTTLTGQLASRKNAILGKLIGILITLVLMFGSYFIFKMNVAIQDVTQINGKVHTVVVAVLEEDKAQTLQDAKDYNFGVQYKFKGDLIKEAVGIVNKEVGQNIATTEYTSVLAQAQALFTEEVGANDILNSVSGNIDTNMPMEEIQELIKDQLDTKASWSIKTMAAEGTGDHQICYSIPGSYVYVAWPVQESVDVIKEAVQAVENGEILEGSEIAE